MPDRQDDRLDSWKEIGAYLNRSVRTVRRWEREEGLPVHRHVHHTLGSVYAYKPELDEWRTTGRRAATRAQPQAKHRRASLKSIAVLPFVNVSANAENDYFAAGLTDEVLSDLSKVRTLRVTSRTSSMRFKGTTKDVRTIASELGVQYIVEGAVRRTNDRLRISAQLIDANADSHVWADKYDGDIEDVFAMQERLARVIVAALELRLTDEESRRLSERPIPDVRAYECFLRARYEAWRWRKDAIDRAVALLQRGLEIVGDNGRLHAAMGLAYLQYREAGVDFSERPLAQAEACAARALAIDPSSSSTVQLRAWIHYARGRVQEAVRDLKIALDIDPHDADTLLLLTNCYLISGQSSSARPLIDRLLAIDPLTPLSRCLPGWADVLQGRFADAVAPYRQMLEMDPGNPMARLFYAWILCVNADAGTAREVVGAFPSEVSDTVPARIAVFLVRANDGDHPGARKALTPDVEMVATAADVFPRLLAYGFARLGDADRVLHWLEIAIDRGFINYPFLARHDPSLSPFRADPRFRQTLETVRQRWMRFQP